MKKAVYICFLLLAFHVLGCGSGVLGATDSDAATANATPNGKAKPTELQKAFQEVAFSYYMRGANIQYNSMKRAVFSPEEATEQNLNYMVCSALPQNIYKELLDINIPPYTQSLLKYSRENLGNPEVIAYGSKNAAGNLIMHFYEADADNHRITIKNPELKDILLRLCVGDVLTYSGHTILVYDLIYDAAGNVVDAYVIQSGHGNKNYHVNTKIPKGVMIGKNIRFGNANHYLYYNSQSEEIFGKEIVRGSLSIVLLSGEVGFRNINTGKKRNEYSVLRFVQNDKDGVARLHYKGESFNDKNHKDEAVKLSAKIKDRLKYENLYISKTVNVHADDMVEAGEKITYTIVVKNDSDKKYPDGIRVTDTLSDYVSYQDSNVIKRRVAVSDNADTKQLSWNIGQLESGEEVKIQYTVTVNAGNEGKIIESTGMVGRIPSAVIKNKIGTNLSKEQGNLLTKKYQVLKHQYSGKELINEVYKQSLGIDLQFDRFLLQDLVTDKNCNSKSGNSISLNSDNRFYNSVLNHYWSKLYATPYSYQSKDDITAYDLKIWKGYAIPERRADTIYSENFRTGDILIYRNENDNLYEFKDGSLMHKPVTFENGEYAYIFVEGQGFVGVNYGNDGVQGTKDDRNEFNADYYKKIGLPLYSNPEETDPDFLKFANYQTLFGKDCYAILRPALGFKIR